MTKAWRIASIAALICLVIGLIGVGVGFFTGSSPVTVQNHGSLAEYMERLTVNWNILRQMLGI